MINRSSILTLQGRVNQEVLKKLKVRTLLSPNKEWFFVDYSSSDISLGKSFDVLMEGENKRLLPNASTIKILSITDQFGHKLDSIPEGFKTICRFEFRPRIPVVLSRLPLLEQWTYNPKAISIAQHEDIEIGTPDATIANLYKIAFTQFKRAANNSTSKSNLTEKEFYEIAEKSLHTNPEGAEEFLQAFVQLGKVKKENKKFVLLEE
jgi:hypothetical protein